MLRTSMGDESLSMLFKRLGREVTKENAHQMCAVACTAPEIFMAPAMGPYKWFMVTDITNIYCTTRGIAKWSAYASIFKNVIGQYGVSEFKSADTLKDIFEAVDLKIEQIRKLLADDDFPPLE